MNFTKVKVRIAPSPTGFLHIGTAQSALYNYLFARKNGGGFLLRIEDTDRERSTKEYEQSILEALEWLGLKWDGNIVRQSERITTYRSASERLLTDKKAFYCGHAKDELEAEQKGQIEAKEPPRHICGHKDEQLKEGIIRLANDSGQKITFQDEVRGPIDFDSKLLGDFSIAKNLNEPLYNFAVVVDDIDMEITHVIRGEDHISNTPKQILIYEALGKTIPVFAHLPLILGNDKSKLSKRHGDTAAIGYKKDYLPEAMINFLGCLGHTFSKEIISEREMIEEFKLSEVHKSGAVFDIKKLNWINAQYIRNLEIEKLRNLVGIEEIPEKALPLITERLEKLSDVQDFDYFWKEPEYDSNLLNWRDFSKDEIKNSLEETKRIIESWDWVNKNALRLLLDDFGKKLGDPSTLLGASRGLVYWPLRVALTGKERSPDPVEVATVLSKPDVLKRIKIAIEKL